MATRSDIRIISDTLRPNLDIADEKALAAIDIAMDYYVLRAVNYMRTHARWTDRTSAARNGLLAKRFGHGDGSSIVMYHSVPYGIWLEVRWSGRYAIIGPTMHEIGPQLQRFVGEALVRAMAAG